MEKLFGVFLLILISTGLIYLLVMQVISPIIKLIKENNRIKR